MVFITKESTLTNDNPAACRFHETELLVNQLSVSSFMD